MKPVQLLPSGTSADAALEAKPNYGLIGGVAVIAVVLLGVGGYFAMARVDSVKSETQQFASQTVIAQNETTKARGKTDSLGRPPVNKDIQIAQGAEAILVSAYGERRKFELMAQELNAVMVGTGGWYETITASATPSVETSGGAAVEIVGLLPSKELASAFDERIDGTKTLSNGELVKVEKAIRVDRETGVKHKYYKFTIHADLAGVSSIVGADTSSLVGNGGDGSLQLSVDAEPRRAKAKKAAAKPATPAAPKNPFEVAASTAGGA